MGLEQTNLKIVGLFAPSTEQLKIVTPPSEYNYRNTFGWLPVAWKLAAMSAKRKAETTVPAEETDQLLIRPLWERCLFKTQLYICCLCPHQYYETANIRRQKWCRWYASTLSELFCLVYHHITTYNVVRAMRHAKSALSVTCVVPYPLENIPDSSHCHLSTAIYWWFNSKQPWPLYSLLTVSGLGPRPG